MRDKELDFALADSVLDFNDGKRTHACKFIQMGLDVGIHSHIYYWANNIRRICASAKKNTEKQNKIRQSKRAQRKDQENNYKLVEGSVYCVRAGFDHFLVNLGKLKLLSLLTLIYKMT